MTTGRSSDPLGVSCRAVEYAAERIREETDNTPGTLLQSLNADPEKMPDAEALDADPLLGVAAAIVTLDAEDALSES